MSFVVLSVINFELTMASASELMRIRIYVQFMIVIAVFIFQLAMAKACLRSLFECSLLLSLSASCVLPNDLDLMPRLGLCGTLSNYRLTPCLGPAAGPHSSF